MRHLALALVLAACRPAEAPCHPSGSVVVEPGQAIPPVTVCAGDTVTITVLVP